MVAYVYEDLSGEQMKRGWVRVEPGKTHRLGVSTDSKRFYVHALRGTTFSPMRSGQRKNFGVWNAAFDGPVGKVLAGPGTRPAQFEELEFSFKDENPVIPIGSCGDYADNKRVTPVVLKAAPQSTVSSSQVAAKSAPPAADAQPVGEVQCTQLDVAPQGTQEAKRLLEMHERGMLRLCGVDSP